MIPANNKSKKVAIIGLGLIGGSLAKALKRAGYKVVGIDKDLETLKAAKKSNIIISDFTEANKKSLTDVDIVFICTPLSLISAYLKKISKLTLKKEIIITDVGSTKFEICNYAAKLSPPSKLISGRDLPRPYICFIGGHPMAGTEKIGFQYSKEDLFKDCIWVLTPTADDKRTKHALNKLKKTILKLKANPIITSPDEHDKAAAIISHFPLLVSLGLCQIVKNVKDKKLKNLVVKMASSGFKDMTRIAGGNTMLSSEILRSNRNEVKKILPNYILELNKLLKSSNISNKLKKEILEISKWRSKLICK